MNSIVERLREARRTHAITAVSLALHTEAADLIEQQAERIKELEAYNATRTDELLAATRRIKELEAWRDSWVKCPEGAAAQRIKELEAKWLDEQKAALTAEAELELANQQIANQQMLSGVYADALAHARSELAALRQRIDDAPVVAWIDELGGLRRSDALLKAAEIKGFPLISKEDLL